MADPTLPPSADPDRTAVRSVSADPGTVDVTADSTDPRAPDHPAGAPLIPGYRVTAEIARGGMGRVFAAVDLTLDREVAIKTLLPGADPTRFVTESKITARLPHPGIPPVYALGTLADGTPFLAMKLIHGRTLAEQLKARPTPQHDLPRFVQTFEQIAQAVGFAHSKGVIHRDLKPLNVMVGSFGEVQVMDWGLAREVASGRAERREPPVDEQNRPLTGHGSPDLTRAGAVMGTPGYMAPEQARGEAVDSRADVFALGSTLAAVLTGKPAFVGTTARESVEKAANADLSDVLARLDGCGADAELVALAKRCLAADRESRPADGRVVADEVAAYRAGVEARLRRAETERAEAAVQVAEGRKRRWVWRWATAAVVGVLLAGIAGTSVGLVLADQARGREKARADGEEQAKIAEREAKEGEATLRVKAEGAYRRTVDVLDAMVSDAAGESLFTQKQVSPEQKKFLAQALAHYREFLGPAGGDETGRERQGRAAYQVGLIEARLNRLDKALAALRTARDAFAELAADFPGTAAHRQKLAVCHGCLGVVLNRLGRRAEAEAEQRRRVAVNRELMAAFPGDRDFPIYLAQALCDLGKDLSDVGKPQAAEAELRQGVALLEPLAAGRPARAKVRQELGRCYMGLGTLLYPDARRLMEAVELVRKGVTVQRALVAESDGADETRHDLGVGLLLLADMLNEALDTRPESEALYAEAVAVRQRLVAEFPGLPEYRHCLARCYNNQAVSHRLAGALAGSEAGHEKAIAVMKGLVAEHPADVSYRLDLATFTCNTAHIARTRGRAADSLPVYAAAVGEFESLRRTEPRDAQAKRGLAYTYHGRAMANHDLGRYAAAEEDWGRAVTFMTFAEMDLGYLVLLGRAKTRVRNGMPREAVADLGRVDSWLNWNADSLYEIAAVYALAADQLPELKVRYGGRAVLMLRDAVAAGFQDATRLRDDKDLDPLRDRADFKKLLADLEAKFPPKREVLPPPRRE